MPEIQGSSSRKSPRSTHDGASPRHSIPARYGMTATALKKLIAEFGRCLYRVPTGGKFSLQCLQNASCFHEYRENIYAELFRMAVQERWLKRIDGEQDQYVRMEKPSVL